MSNFLNFAGNSGVTFKNHGTGGGTSFTLDKSASTNSVLLSIGGIIQKPSTDYTVSGTAITTTSSVTSGVEVFSLIIHDAGNAPVIEDNSIVTAKIADNQVTGAKIAMGSDAAGDILYYNGTDYVRLAKGTALQQLRINSGASAPEWATITASNDYEFVSSDTASGGASIDFTNMADGYDYIYVLQHISAATNATEFRMEVGVSGPSYRTSSYKCQTYHVTHSDTISSYEDTHALLMVNDQAEGMGDQSDEAIKAGEVVLYNPANASTQTAFDFKCTNYGATPQIKQTWGGGYYTTAEANIACRFKTSSGNCTGTILQFRRKRS